MSYHTGIPNMDFILLVLGISLITISFASYDFEFVQPTFLGWLLYIVGTLLMLISVGMRFSWW